MSLPAPLSRLPLLISMRSQMAALATWLPTPRTLSLALSLVSGVPFFSALWELLPGGFAPAKGWQRRMMDSWSTMEATMPTIRLSPLALHTVPSPEIQGVRSSLRWRRTMRQLSLSTPHPTFNAQFRIKQQQQQEQSITQLILSFKRWG